ncbi:MAG: hypothetical protein ACR2OB_04440, partial [Solirubrobacteraceae bacterium]
MTAAGDPEADDEPLDDESPEPRPDDGDDPDATDAPELEAWVVVWLRASAGSWPETSWTKIPPVVARK